MKTQLQLNGIALVLAAGLCAAAPGTGSGGDIERFEDDRVQENRWMVPGDNQGLTVCRYRSRAGNCFRLKGHGHYGPGDAMFAPLGSEASFRQFTIELLLDPGELKICEIADNWSPWKAVESSPRTHKQSFLEERFCSPGIVSDAPACPCRSLRESRTRNISNPT